MRTTERITVTVPKHLVARAKADVADGLAPSVSAWIADAMEERAGSESLADVVADLLEATGGPTTEEEKAWAKKMLSRSYWTQERSSRSSEADVSP